ncbi:endolytic transglycosylase MltG [Kitasatospora sp. NPDC050543]|uniref:endolytic transglycosylase MltG n=1 Tax=Kitasatospora sp. NPDC050543 TaxID=3364054 RepID=UPI00378F672F
MTDQEQLPGLTPGHLGAPAPEPAARPPGRPRRPGPPDPYQRRTGLACGLTALALVTVIGGGGLVGYSWLAAQQTPRAADYTGSGTGTVQVSVPQGAGLSTIAAALVRQGVIASSRAFSGAATGNTKAAHIQPGTYTLHLRMSAAAALAVLVNPANANGLTIPEGWRGSQIYSAIDQKLKLPEGTAKAAAEEHAGELGLPGFTAGSPEGYLYPSTYSVTEQSTALGLLKKMVEQAGKQFAQDNTEGAAALLGQTPYAVVTVASLVQAEADNAEDMAKVARVIYNRLARNMPLQLDSTINYALGRSTLDTTVTDTKLDSPYNTYLHTGLPPTPISNPGAEAMQAATEPAQGDWLYFVTVRPGDTRFTDSLEQQQRNVAEFNANRASQSSAPASPSGGEGTR